MPRNVGISIENAFNKGLITEVTGVNSPENSVTDTLNILYDRRGRAIKRNGFELEPDSSPASIALNNVVYTEYVWKTISNNISRDFVVVQIGSTLRFYQVEVGQSISGGLKSFSVNLLTYKTPNFANTVVANAPVSYSTGRGYLFIAHPNCDTIYIRYSDTTDTISVTRITVQIRDLEGLSDSRPVDQRSSTITNTQKYNLYNQGWYTETVRANGSSGIVFDLWDEARTDYPSQVDVWWYYTSAGSVQEFFDPRQIPAKTGLYGNTPAPKGHYILNAFQTNRSSQSGIPVSETTSSGLRPSVVSFYSGRAFYAGVGKSGFSSLIYFSQIIERDDQLGRCYQTNDPTSREIFDLLPSDGGIIDIQEINTIYDLKVVGDSLIVFASNGIWSISGTDNGPFQANDYTVTKITSESAISRMSIVDVSGTPIWWNNEGIFALNISEAGLTKDVTSLTTSTIQTFYDDIPQTVKASAKGVYNNQEKLVYWLYSTDADLPNQYDRILVFDATTLAFYVYSMSTSVRLIKGVVSVESSGPTYADSNVVTNLLDNVVTQSGEQVYVEEYTGLASSGMEFKFVTQTGASLTFSQMTPDVYLDWGSVSYEAFFLTGYRVRGELMKSAQTNYLSVLMEVMLNSSCFVQPVWDYANNRDSGRYGNPQQAYKQETLYDYSTRRLKIRGTGKSVQFLFTAETGKPMRIIGWAGYETSNTSP